MSTDKPKTYIEQWSRAELLANDITRNVIEVLIEKGEVPGVVVFALSMMMGRIMPIAMRGEGDFRADLKEAQNSQWREVDARLMERHAGVEF